VTIGPFLVRRLGSGLLAILGASLLTFSFLHLVPGDPVDHLAGGDAPPGMRIAIERCMGLDRSLPGQFVAFLGHIADGTLGHQCRNGDPGGPTVADRVAEVMPHTLALAVCGMLVAIGFALPLGALAAVRRGRWIDTAATVVSLSGIAVPQMMFAPLLLL
jgi:ABC-type dipeptide/oligopeptide/nickel transport system permease component